MHPRSRENRIRRMADRQGYRLEKSRRRDPFAIEFGGYWLVDERNIVRLGTTCHPYDATLDEIEGFLTTKRGKGIL